MHKFYRSLFERYNSHYNFVVSHVALGETIHEFMNKDLDLTLDEICSKLHHYNINVKSIPDLDILVKIINKIREYDDRLNHNDIVIVATAIADPQSKGLITTDSDMIGNIAINEAAKFMNKPKFIVSDNPFKKKRR